MSWPHVRGVQPLSRQDTLRPWVLTVQLNHLSASVFGKFCPPPPPPTLSKMYLRFHSLNILSIILRYELPIEKSIIILNSTYKYYDCGLFVLSPSKSLAQGTISFHGRACLLSTVNPVRV